MADPIPFMRIAGVALAVSVAVVYLGFRASGSRVGVEAGMPTFSDFEVESGDERVRLSGFEGKVVAVYFGYAGCPDICPTTLATLGTAFQELTPAQQAHTRGLFVSVDPERDTPAQAKAYAAFFHPNIVGGTSDAAAISAIAMDWGIGFEKANGASEAMGYTVDHTSIVFLVAPDGRMKKAVPHGGDPSALAEAIVKVMEGPAG